MLSFNSAKEVEELCKKEEKKLVIFGDKVYDVAEFLGKHPGGRKIIEKHIGATTAQKAFDDIEHSYTAKEIIGSKRVP